MLEVVGAAVLLMAIVAFAVPSLTGSGGTPGDDGDAQARLAVSATLDAEQAYAEQFTIFAPASALTAARLARLQAVAGNVESTSATQVSVDAATTASGVPVVGIAVRGTSQCWMARLALAGPVTWATTSTAAVCTGAAAAQISAGPGKGAGPDRPLRLDA